MLGRSASDPGDASRPVSDTSRTVATTTTIDTPDHGQVRLRADGDRLRLVVDDNYLTVSVELSADSVERLIAALGYFAVETAR